MYYCILDSILALNFDFSHRGLVLRVKYPTVRGCNDGGNSSRGSPPRRHVTSSPSLESGGVFSFTFLARSRCNNVATFIYSLLPRKCCVTCWFLQPTWQAGTSRGRLGNHSCSLTCGISVVALQLAGSQGEVQPCPASA